MSIFNFLQLQPVEPKDDGTVSDLDVYEPDETIDLNEEIDEATLDAAWDKVIHDLDEDPEKLTFSNEDE